MAVSRATSLRGTSMATCSGGGDCSSASLSLPIWLYWDAGGTCATNEPPDERSQRTYGEARGPGSRPFAGDRLAVQAPGLRLPQQRDLRRPERRLRLRPAWRRAEEQRQA